MTALLLALLAISVPDPALTPGTLCTAASAGFDGIHHGAPHCRRRVTVSARRTALARYGVPWAQRGLYELDHYIPLCLGGSNDLANLFPQSWESAKRKDVLERRLCAAFAAGRLSQDEAVARLRAWR
jgi:hypothetical protein